jgi:phosphoribosylformimino-5-aminoimidazole carboxamide ribotide isomerase
LQIIPAIDIRDGRCVRLWQGDYARETVYAGNPVQVAVAWQEAGAKRLHIVDLDGAAGRAGVNAGAIRSIVQAVAIPVELGGGLRHESDLDAAFALGVDRAVLGTVAVENPELVALAAARFGEAIAVGIDARAGLVATHGWRETSKLSALTLAERMVSLGVRRVIYTDIARDGTLAGPNLSAMTEMARSVPVPVIASGGVASLADLLALAQTGVEAAIVGRALYTGGLDLREALRTLGGEEHAD